MPASDASAARREIKTVETELAADRALTRARTDAVAKALTIMVYEFGVTTPEQVEHFLTRMTEEGVTFDHSAVRAHLAVSAPVVVWPDGRT